jgi:hypothetical protein
MTSSIHAAPSPACTASTSSASRRQKRIDFLTRYCGLSLPTLFKRIGTMAAPGQPLPSQFQAWRRAHPRPWSAARAELARPLAKTTPTALASGPAERLDNRKRMAVAKPSSRPIATHQPRRQGMHARAGPFA